MGREFVCVQILRLWRAGRIADVHIVDRRHLRNRSSLR
jgi:hypothetical protein